MGSVVSILPFHVQVVSVYGRVKSLNHLVVTEYVSPEALGRTRGGGIERGQTLCSKTFMATTTLHPEGAITTCARCAEVCTQAIAAASRAAAEARRC